MSVEDKKNLIQEMVEKSKGQITSDEILSKVKQILEGGSNK